MKPKKTKKEFEKCLLEMIAEYVPILMLTNHTFDVVSGCQDKDSLMEFKLTYPYLNPKIYYSEKSLKMWKNGKTIRPFLLHELCHGITDPFYVKASKRYATNSEIEDERERLTDHICNIVLSITDNRGKR